MRIPGRNTLRRLVRRWRRRWRPGGLVLGYHRVAESSWDPLGLCVSPENFAAQLEAVGRRREFVSLPELRARHAAGAPLEGLAAVTFDDGYSGLTGAALEILGRRGIPATVFVATGYLGSSYWWEEITSLLRPPAESDELEITLPGGRLGRYRGLRQAGGAAAAVRDLSHRLACAKVEDIRAVLDQLRDRTGRQAQAADGEAPLSPDQVRVLGRTGGIELGAHTVSHGCLGGLDPDRQREEIVLSRDRLREIAGVDVSSFSYPNGSYSRETPALLRELGFRQACSSEQALFCGAGDPMLIPRIWPADLGGGAFGSWLGRWARDLS